MTDKYEGEKELRKLRAELTIVKSNLKKLEKENEALKFEKSKYLSNMQDIEQNVKRKLEFKEKETRIAENQKKLFKLSDTLVQGNDETGAVSQNGTPNACLFYNKADSTTAISLGYPNHITSETISASFILEQTLSNLRSPDGSIDEVVLFSDEFLKSLKFYKTFYFDYFYAIPEQLSLEICNKFLQKDQRRFIDIFELFSCHKSVFSAFLTYVFDDNSFLSSKVSILQSTPSEWIVEIYINKDAAAYKVLSKFIEINKGRLLSLFSKIAENCPFYLIHIFSKNEFNELLFKSLQYNSIMNPEDLKYMNLILYHIAKNKIKSYIDETNLHLIPTKFLKQIFGDEYFAFDGQ